MSTKSPVKPIVAALIAGAAGVLAIGPAPAGASASGTGSSGTGDPTGVVPFSGTDQSVCGAATPGYATCLSRVVSRGDEQSRVPGFNHPGRNAANAAVTVSGLSPTNLEAVYGFSTSSTAGAGKTIAIVDAYDDPTAANDLATFSTQWGLPACTTANGCFTKMNQNWQASPLPSSTNSQAAGWALEISLDIEWAHAVAPGAKILLIEANSNSFSDLMAAEWTAGEHANYVSDSWGGSEFSTEVTSDYFYFPAGASYFAATGDVGAAVDYPATSPEVVAVGGTYLSFASNGSLSNESAWSLGGGGCSAYETAPAAQSGFAQHANSGCNGARSVPDVSLDASPNSGVAVYDSTPYSGSPGGWWTVGGTSLATPVWAAESAVSGAPENVQSIYSSTPTPSFRDIVSGSNGHPAQVGYDLATGRGSWAIGAPAAPTNLTGSAVSDGVSLSWTSAPGATSYNVYRGSTATGLSTTPIATNVSGTTYKDTTTSSTNSYYYEVEGVNSTANGPPSNEVSIGSGGGTGGGGGSPPPPPPPPPPNAPTLSGSMPYPGLVSLSWTSPTGSNSFNVYRGTSSGGETLLAHWLGTSYTDFGPFTPGTTYYYKVATVSGSTIGPMSNELALAMPSSLKAGISKSCSGSNCTFTSTSTDTNGSITQYSWSTSGATGVSKTFTHTFATGSWTVSLTVADNHGATSSASVGVSCTTKTSGKTTSVSCS